MNIKSLIERRNKTMVDAQAFITKEPVTTEDRTNFDRMISHLRCRTTYHCVSFDWSSISRKLKTPPIVGSDEILIRLVDGTQHAFLGLSKIACQPPRFCLTRCVASASNISRTVTLSWPVMNSTTSTLSPKGFHCEVCSPRS